MGVEEMEGRNDDKRAFCKAVCSGNVEEARSMLSKDSGLAMREIKKGVLPVHMAATCGHHKMLRFLLDQIKLDDLHPKQRDHLFLTTLKNSMHGNEKQLFFFLESL